MPNLKIQSQNKVICQVTHIVACGVTNVIFAGLFFGIIVAGGVGGEKKCR